MRGIMALFITGAAIAAPAALPAQRADIVQQGATIRVLMKGRSPQIGRLDSLTVATLAMSITDRTSSSVKLNIEREKVLGLQVRGRSRVKGALRGAGLGFLAGAVSGFTLAALTYKEEANCWMLCSRTDVGMLGALVGSVIVIPIGIIGGATQGAGTWKRVDPSTATMP